MYKLITKNEDILNVSNSVSWSSSSDSLGTQLTFTSKKDLKLFQVVSLYIENIELFRGVILLKSFETEVYSYTLQDYSFYLEQNEMIKQFNNVYASTAIKSLFSEAYLEYEVCDIPTIIDGVFEGSLMSILDEILEKAELDQGTKYIKEIVGNKVYVRKYYENKIYPSLVIVDTPNIEVDGSAYANSVTAYNNSDENGVNIYAVRNVPNEFSYYGKINKLVSVDEENIPKASNIAQNTLNDVNRLLKKYSFEAVITRENAKNLIRANKRIWINQQEFKDFFLVKSVTHTLENNTHKVSIEIEEEEEK